VAGVSEDEIRQAVAVGEMVKRTVYENTKNFTDLILNKPKASADLGQPVCSEGCT
jgi:hypothetical protein